MGKRLSRIRRWFRRHASISWFLIFSAINLPSSVLGNYYFYHVLTPTLPIQVLYFVINAIFFTIGWIAADRLREKI